MARIVRKNQKIFAEDASNNGVFGSLQSNNPVTSSDPDVLQSRTAFSNGWNDATYSSELLPPLEEFQGLQYLFSRQLAYIFQEGISEWNTDTVYFKGSVVKAIDDADIKIYVSLTDNNSGNLVTDTTKWKMVFDSSAPYADYYFSNLSSVAKNIGNWSTNVSNCITEIPQDIKLELSSGTLTLKAGSKIYQPNGAGVFDVITTTTDLTCTASANGSNFIRYENGVLFADWGVSSYSSGADPTGVTGWFYDTTANYIGYYNSGTRTNQISFPLGIVTVSGGAITSIDQVFNGFGFIGSTVFALPDVKGLAPAGRNADGTLKSNEISISSVIIGQCQTYDAYCLLSDHSIGFYGSKVTEYREKENRLYDTYADSYIPTDRFVFGFVYQSSGVITRLKTNTAFHALDWNDSREIVSWGIPDATRAVQISLPYTTNEDCYIAFKQQGESGSAAVGNGILVDSVYGCASTNGVWGQTIYPVMYGGLYVARGRTVSATSSTGTYTVYYIPLKGVVK